MSHLANAKLCWLSKDVNFSFNFNLLFDRHFLLGWKANALGVGKLDEISKSWGCEVSGTLAKGKPGLSEKIVNVKL